MEKISLPKILTADDYHEFYYHQKMIRHLTGQNIHVVEFGFSSGYYLAVAYLGKSDTKKLAEELSSALVGRKKAGVPTDKIIPDHFKIYDIVLDFPILETFGYQSFRFDFPEELVSDVKYILRKFGVKHPKAVVVKDSPSVKVDLVIYTGEKTKKVKDFIAKYK